MLPQRLQEPRGNVPTGFTYSQSKATIQPLNSMFWNWYTGSSYYLFLTWCYLIMSHSTLVKTRQMDAFSRWICKDPRLDSQRSSSITGRLQYPLQRRVRMALLTHHVTWSYDHLTGFILHICNQMTTCPDKASFESKRVSGFTMLLTTLKYFYFYKLKHIRPFSYASLHNCWPFLWRAADSMFHCHSLTLRSTTPTFYSSI